MGRAPLKREFIRDDKKRRLTFEQRKKSMLKKADELSNLCDVKVGILIYGDDETVVWNSSKSDDDFEELIRLYKAQPFDQKKKTSTTSSILLEDQMKKSTSDLSKLQEENNNAGYPTWDKTYDDLSEEELREHARVLDAKIEQVKGRMEFLEGNQFVCINNFEPHQDVSMLLDQFDFSGSDYDIMNGGCTDDCYFPQFTDSLYFSGGNQFSFDPTMDNGAAFMCYNDMQQYNTGVQSFDGLDGDIGACF